VWNRMYKDPGGTPKPSDGVGYGWGRLGHGFAYRVGLSSRHFLPAALSIML